MTSPSRTIPAGYWRAALAELNLFQPELPSSARTIELAQVEGVWRVTGAADEVEAWTRIQFAASKTPASDVIPFLLTPARLAADARGEAPALLCIACRLKRSGELVADPQRMPWIPRELLAPTLARLAVGTLDQHDQFIASLPFKPASLDDALAIAADLFEAVTGAVLPALQATLGRAAGTAFAAEGHTLVSHWFGMPCDPPVIARHIIKLYDQIAYELAPLPLFENLASTIERPARAPLSVGACGAQYAATVGHIDTRHPLSPSQRIAMTELALLPEGGVLAVNGPPGTGKTTLLQSVVAQLWVDAALAQGECPMIVVASTNVKAVENVLYSFASICEHTGHERWHPYPGGFGLFLASESRQSSYPVCTAKSQPFTDWEARAPVYAAQRTFIEKAQAQFPGERAIVNIVAKLHAQLEHHAQRLRALIGARHAIHKASGAGLHDGASSTCERLIVQYQADIQSHARQARIWARAIATCHDATAAATTTYAEAVADILRAEAGWVNHMTHSPLWLDLLAFVPLVRRQRAKLDRTFLASERATVTLNDRSDEPAAFLHNAKLGALHTRNATQAAIAERFQEAEQQRQAALAQQRLAQHKLAEIETLLDQWRDALQGDLRHLHDATLDDLEDALDLALRAPMFGLADHYWTGRWLLQQQQRLSNMDSDTRGRVKLEAKYRRFAKLSPCLVTNVHMAPAFFTAWQGDDIPLWNTIDLLIVDEAGQVAPDVGAGLFALAKRALVVGDVHQIEPIWSTGQGVDRTTAVQFGLTSAPHDPEYDRLADAGYLNASGTLMAVANRACAVQQFQESRGLMLLEHRRCLPPLIDFCNQLSYAGRLQPLRTMVPSALLFQPFEAIHVAGRDVKAGASRTNDEEAHAVVDWLMSNRTRIEAHYSALAGAPRLLSELVGVVTPFAAQAGLIGALLRKHVARDITVGTVHALQGAERAIVVFSPTYGTKPIEAFYDQSPNLLNVAVSRARDSFIVIGNLALFDASRPDLPSGLLAKYMLPT
ncbi:DEAD/DEAH box helicase [Massilia sp. S19_KUP03_FR1]|uniref:DEAD/DEAH box helicase n=1 Tax=Massilia sp. S19_KUP03_FR1 TaxID=3025503 RepID=UPI002FCCCE0D